MRVPLACVSLAVGAALMIIPPAVMLAYTEQLTKLSDVARMANVIHVGFCVLTGFGLIVIGVLHSGSSSG